MGREKLARLLLITTVLATRPPAAAPGGAPNCSRSCGGIQVPYPFGMAGDNDSCYLSASFSLTCNRSHDPPKLLTRPFDYYSDAGFEVAGILLPSALLRVLSPVSYDCYNFSNSTDVRIVNVTFPDTFALSSSGNVFTAVGCETETWLLTETETWVGCMLGCGSLDGIRDGQCLGMGCSEVVIPGKATYYRTGFYSRSEGSSTSTFSNCSYSFPVERGSYSFRKSHLAYMDRNTGVPLLLDWFVGNRSCREAAKDPSSFACASSNSECFDSANGPGYICNCSLGYQGNPYLKDGCQDIDECKLDRTVYPCYGDCVNTRGSYLCVCPKGSFSADPRKERCIPETSRLSPGVKAAIGIAGGLGGLSFLFVIVASCALLRKKSRKRRARILEFKLHDKNYKLLEQLVASHGGSIVRTRIFHMQEMEKATNKFDAARVVGRGGFGTVYKGLLLDNTVVAIKRLNKLDRKKEAEEAPELELEIQQFINEVAILTQIDHRNVVRLLGCCLESEVPLLVYEFVSNSTLSDHLHIRKRSSCLPWADRLRIATEIASAVSYMHSAASRSIFHRDLKTCNVLLDEKLTAKVSDFGTSKSLTADQTHITTRVQGTYGYLDPEYYHTGMLTEKSDVFSLGVILLELLTGEPVFPQGRSETEGSLVSSFISAIEEDRVVGLLEALVVEEAGGEDIGVVVALAERCLRLRGEERPTMKEVEMVLRGLWK